jgi:biopolymer transport protein ExbD
MRRFSRRRRSTHAALPEIPLTPLIDTAMNLLIIFMVATPMMNNMIKVELPRGAVREGDPKQQELVVFIDKHEKLYINGNQLKNQDAVIKELQRLLGSDKERTIFVKADQAVNYGYVIELVDHLKSVGGVAYVALATQRA